MRLIPPPSSGIVRFSVVLHQDTPECQSCQNNQRYISSPSALTAEIIAVNVGVSDRKTMNDVLSYFDS